jgi:hypothetical protein
MDIKTAYYRDREKEIQGLAREFYEGIAESVQARYGSVKAEEIRKTALERFQEILSDLPDIGGVQCTKQRLNQLRITGKR